MSKMAPHKDYAIAELTRGRSSRSLAEELGVSHSAVIRFAKANGVSLSRVEKGSIEPEKDRIIELYSMGLSIEDVALIVGRAASTIATALKRWKVQTRPAPGSVEAIDKISLNDLKSDWIEVKKPHVVTVGKIGRFYLIPISKAKELAMSALDAAEKKVEL